MTNTWVWLTIYWYALRLAGWLEELNHQWWHHAMKYISKSKNITTNGIFYLFFLIIYSTTKDVCTRNLDIESNDCFPTTHLRTYRNSRMAAYSIFHAICTGFCHVLCFCGRFISCWYIHMMLTPYSSILLHCHNFPVPMKTHWTTLSKWISTIQKDLADVHALHTLLSIKKE